MKPKKHLIPLKAAFPTAVNGQVTDSITQANGLVFDAAGLFNKKCDVL